MVCKIELNRLFHFVTTAKPVSCSSEDGEPFKFLKEGQAVELLINTDPWSLVSIPVSFRCTLVTFKSQGKVAG